MDLPRPGTAEARGEGSPFLGTIGRLSIFIWSLGMGLLTPWPRVLAAALMCLAVGAVVYPNALRRVLRPRWLVWMALLALPCLFFLGEIDRTLLGIGYSSEGLQVGVQIALRFIVLLVAVEGFTGAVDTPALAGLLERMGMKSRGFSVGVALNLLPGLQRSSQDAWQTLRMRGGLRKRRWRGLRLLIVTIITGGLRRAKEVALAAEARAFSPENIRPLPIQKGLLDWPLLGLGMASIIMIIVL